MAIRENRNRTPAGPCSCHLEGPLGRSDICIAGKKPPARRPPRVGPEAESRPYLSWLHEGSQASACRPRGIALGRGFGQSCASRSETGNRPLLVVASLAREGE